MLGDDAKKKSKVASLLSDDESEEDAPESSNATIGEALLEAIDSKDAAQIGAALRNAVKLCSYSKDEEEE